MQTTREYITKQGESKMVSLTIGISEALQLQVTGMQNSLRSGEIALNFIMGSTQIIIFPAEMRATANAFAHLADLLDAEAKND